MDKIKQDFPHRVGCGVCKDDFTIDEKVLAGFTDLSDAKEYIKDRIFNDLSSFQKVFFIDAQVEDGPSMLTVRDIYDANRKEFIEGKDIVSSNREIYVMGYEVSADYEDEEGNYDYTEHTICISYTSAKLKRQEYVKNGAVEVKILEKDDIGIQTYFWDTAKFLKGTADNDRLGKIINDMRSTPFKQGETTAQRVGTVLDEVSNEEMMQYFEKHVLGGAGLIRNYLETQIINDEIGRDQAARWKAYEER